MVELRRPDPQAVTLDARPPPESAPRGSKEGMDISRADYVNVSVPKSLITEIRQRHVPSRAQSAQAFVVFWTRLGCIVDTALADSSAPDVATRIVDALRALEKRE